MFPQVDFSENIKLPDIKDKFRDILQRTFPDYQRVVVESEFVGDTFSGSWVFLVYLISRDNRPNLPVVVKIASTSLIDKEWHAYDEHIRGKWPKTAEIRESPVSAPDGVLSGLYYFLEGYGIVSVGSLWSYCQDKTTTVEDIQAVFQRFAKFFAEGVLLYCDRALKHHLRASYDQVLPVNLLIEPASLPSDVEPVLVTPQALPASPLKPGSYVRLKDFVVTKVDLKKYTITLNLSRPTNRLPNDSYYVRLKFEPGETMPACTIGQTVPAVEGRVVQTRYSQWQDEMKKVMTDQGFDWDSETVFLPDGTSLPNPFASLQDGLGQFRNIKVGYIHGDLNLGNILVDPDVKDVCLIDFAEARWDHVLHDCLRLETEVVTKLIPPALIEADLPVETICRFYEQLHCATFHSLPSTAARSPHPALDKPFAISKVVRQMARDHGLFNRNECAEYYHCLTFYLLGALKFKNLDEVPEAPLPKQLAFWVAATVQELLQEPPPCEEMGWVTPTPLALIIGVRPQVKVKRAGTDTMQEASFGTPLYPGDMVSTFAQAAASVVCDNGLLFELPENNNFTVDCTDMNDTRLVGCLGPTVPNPLISLAKAFGLPPDQPTARFSRAEQSQTPLLLSPRNTSVADPRPTFHWQPVPGAISYHLDLLMPGGQSWSRETADTTLPYPDDAPPLPPGSANVVSLLALAPTPSGDKTLLQMLAEPRLAELAEAKAVIRSLAVDETARSYLLGQLYQEQGLWGDAIAQLKQLAAQPGPAPTYLCQQLGDLYFKLDLYVQAQEQYQEALTAAEINADPSAQASAHVGLGRVAAAFGETKQAIHHLTKAETLYRETKEIARADAVADERAILEHQGYGS